MANDGDSGPQLLPATWKNLFYPPELNEYTYFAHAAKYPFLGSQAPEAQRHLVKAAWAADAAMLAYGRYGQTPIPPTDFQKILADAEFLQCDLIGDWAPGARGTQGFFARNNDFAILSFRGTERDDASDVETDANILLSEEPEHDASPAPKPDSSLLDRVVHGAKDFLLHTSRVHFGFQRALDQVWPQVEKLLNDYRAAHPQAEIVFTGHSLGAALATLAVARFRGDGGSLYTIGSPRVGNAPFGDMVRRQTGGKIFRFVNHQDLVTHVPIEAPFYRHVEEQGLIIGADGAITQGVEDAEADIATLAELLKQLWTTGKLLELNTPAPAPLVDHSPARYCKLLRYHLEQNVPSAK